MKWMRGRNHILQHVTCENPTEDPTTQPTLFRVMVWYGAASLWPLATYKAFQTPFICIKWIWYEYEVDGRSQSYPAACPLHSVSYNPVHPF